MTKSTTLFERLGGSTPVFDPQHNFVTSPFFSSAVLASIRGAVALYTFTTLLFALIWENVNLHDGSGYFSYFTQLTNIGLCAYYWASFVQTVAYVRGGRKGYPLQKWGKTLQVLHMMLGTTIVAYPILVTVVYWALLASSSTFSTPFSTWDNISMHALNTVYSLFEAIFTNSPPPSWLMVPVIIIILALYLALAYVTHATQGFYTYSFLDPSKEHAKLAAYIVGILVADLIIFSLVKGIMSARQRLTRRNRTASSTGSSTARDSAVGDDDEKKGDVERGFSPWTDLGEETLEDDSKSAPRAL